MERIGEQVSSVWQPVRGAVRSRGDGHRQADDVAKVVVAGISWDSGAHERRSQGSISD